jgi:tetratricopeptide (TPR) repeat protein
MNRTERPGALLLALLVLFLASCASNQGWVAYRDGLAHGYTSLQNSEYQLAIQQLLSASQGDPTKVIPLALAGQAAYQMGNYTEASRYLAQAEGIIKGPNAAYIIVKGYQALIAFRTNRQQEGMTALGEYVRVYRFNYPDRTYYDVERMYQSKQIVLPTLEGYINNELARYESELQEWGWTWGG